MADKHLFELSALNAGGLSLDTVTVDLNGKQLETVGTVSLKGSIPSSGTFTSKGFLATSLQRLVELSRRRRQHALTGSNAASRLDRRTP